MTLQEAERIAELEKFARTIEPSTKIFIKDDSPLMKFLGFFVRLFNKGFAGVYTTTIANRVYIPRQVLFAGDLRRLLVHEVEGHVRQCRYCGLGIHPLLGILLYGFLYGLCFFPIGLALFRYLFERNADMKSWRWMILQGIPVSEVQSRMENFAETVSSWDYFKPWPKKWVEAGFRRSFDKVVKGFGAGIVVR